MRTMLKAAAGLFLLLLTSACLVETEATIADADPKMADAKLVGSWYHAEKGEAIILSIAADEKAEGVYRIVFATIKPGSDEPVESTAYRAWRTVVNNRAYITGELIGAPTEGMPKRTLISYDIEGDVLVLRLMDTTLLAEAIASGKLKGKVVKGGYVDQITITAPRAELAAFIAAADYDKLFSVKAERLRKMGEVN